MEISKKMGIDYKIYSDMAGKLVTTKFDKLKFEEAIKQIVGNNYAIVYADGNMKAIKKLYVFSKGKEGSFKEALIQNYHKNIFPDVGVLKKVVDQRVKTEQPNAQFFEMIPHSDLNGELVSYLFSYYIGQDGVPAKDSLEMDIREAWKEKQDALKNIHECYSKRDSARIIEATTKADSARFRISRENDFISIEVGADYDSPPIIAFWNGLPLDISQYPRAVEVVNERLKDNNLEFSGAYKTGLFSIAFGFEGKDNKTYYVDSDSWKIFTSWEEVPNDNNKNAEKEEIKERNKLKWSEFLDI